MESRLTGSWKITEEEEVSQSKFIKIISSPPTRIQQDLLGEKIHGFINPEAKISQKYLEYNSSFLSDDKNY